MGATGRRCTRRRCPVLTSRAFVVMGIGHRPVVAYACGKHGRRILESLMALWPGHAISSNGVTVTLADIPEDPA